MIAERVLKAERIKKNPRNRYERHVNRLYAILKALNIELDENTIEDLVHGDVTFWDLRKELFRKNNDEKSKAIVEIAKDESVETERVEEKEDVSDVKDIDFSMESALGIKRETFEDFLTILPTSRLQTLR